MWVDNPHDTPPPLKESGYAAGYNVFKKKKKRKKKL